MGLKYVEIEPQYTENLPICQFGSQILEVVEQGELMRSSGIWSVPRRVDKKFVVSSLDISPLLVVKREEKIAGPARAEIGETVAWNEIKTKEEIFRPALAQIQPGKFIAGSAIGLKLGNNAVEITLWEDEESFPVGDEPSSCTFEAGRPDVYFALVHMALLNNVRVIPMDET